jgi:hypothetical protein
MANIHFHLVKLQYDMPEVNSSVTFHLDGYKYNSLIGRSRFVGNIIIDDTKIEQVDIRLNNLGPLIGRINEEGDMSTYGAIYLDDSLQEVTSKLRYVNSSLSKRVRICCQEIRKFTLIYFVLLSMANIHFYLLRSKK